MNFLNRQVPIYFIVVPNKFINYNKPGSFIIMNLCAACAQLCHLKLNVVSLK